MSQAEHDTAAQSILITDSHEFAEEVQQHISAILADLPRADIARESLTEYGAIIVVDNMNPKEARIVRKELFQRYPNTYHGRLVSQQRSD